MLWGAVRLNPTKCEEMIAVCACFNLRKATRVVTQLFDQALSPSGLRSTQLPILLTLALTPSASMSSLAEQMMMDRTTLTRNLMPLERRALIQIVPGGDRRIREVRLTEAGRKAAAAATPLWEEAQARVIQALGQEQSQGLQRAVTALLSVQRQAIPNWR